MWESPVAGGTTTALPNLLIACFPFSSGLAAHDFLLMLILILFKLFTQKLTVNSVLSFLLLFSSVTAFLCLCFPLPLTFNSSRRKHQDTSPYEPGNPIWTFFCVWNSAVRPFFLYMFDFLSFNFLLRCRKTKKMKKKWRKIIHRDKLGKR